MIEADKYHDAYKVGVETYFTKSPKTDAADPAKIIGEDYDNFSVNFKHIISKHKFDESDYAVVYMHLICNQYSRASGSTLTKWQDDEQMKPFYDNGVLNRRTVRKESLESNDESQEMELDSDDGAVAKRSEKVAEQKRSKIVPPASSKRPKSSKNKTIAATRTRLIDDEAEEEGAASGHEEAEETGPDEYEKGSFIVSDSEAEGNDSDLDIVSQCSSRYSGKKRKSGGGSDKKNKKFKKSGKGAKSAKANAILADLSGLEDSDSEVEIKIENEEPAVVSVLDVLEELGVSRLTDVVDLTQKLAIKKCEKYLANDVKLPNVFSATGMKLSRFVDTSAVRESLTECLFSAFVALSQRAVRLGRDVLLEKQHSRAPARHSPVKQEYPKAYETPRYDAPVAQTPDFGNPLYSSGGGGNNTDFDDLLGGGPSYNNKNNENQSVRWWQILEEIQFDSIVSHMSKEEKEDFTKKASMECGKRYSGMYGLRKDPITGSSIYKIEDKPKMLNIAEALKAQVRQKLSSR